jgi:hypothetical protein
MRCTAAEAWFSVGKAQAVPVLFDPLINVKILPFSSPAAYIHPARWSIAGYTWLITHLRSAMKKQILSPLAAAFVVSLLAGTASAQDRTPAPQEKPAPSQALPEDHMPVLRSQTTPIPMPPTGMQGGMVDRETGRYILYNDSRTGLGFNFEKQEITDYKTGKVYKFSEHPAYKSPKKEPKKSI